METVHVLSCKRVKPVGVHSLFLSLSYLYSEFLFPSVTIEMRLDSESHIWVCSNEHAGDGGRLFSAPRLPTPPPVMHCLPASLPISPPSPIIGSHRVPLSSKDKWLSEQSLELCVCVCERHRESKTWRWMAQCFSHGCECNVLLLTDRRAHSHSAFPFLHLISLSSCYEYRLVLGNLHTVYTNIYTDQSVNLKGNSSPTITHRFMVYLN